MYASDYRYRRFRIEHGCRWDAVRFRGLAGGCRRRLQAFCHMLCGWSEKNEKAGGLFSFYRPENPCRFKGSFVAQRRRSTPRRGLSRSLTISLGSSRIMETGGPTCSTAYRLWPPTGSATRWWVISFPLSVMPCVQCEADGMFRHIAQPTLPVRCGPHNAGCSYRT
jgi:hypothetical protein